MNTPAAAYHHRRANAGQQQPTTSIMTFVGRSLEQHPGPHFAGTPRGLWVSVPAQQLAFSLCMDHISVLRLYCAHKFGDVLVKAFGEQVVLECMDMPLMSLWRENYDTDVQLRAKFEDACSIDDALQQIDHAIWSQQQQQHHVRAGEVTEKFARLPPNNQDLPIDDVLHAVITPHGAPLFPSMASMLMSSAKSMP